jgi:hypothetical protein
MTVQGANYTKMLAFKQLSHYVHYEALDMSTSFLARNPQNQHAPTSKEVASTLERDAPIKKKDQSTSSTWGKLLKLLQKCHKLL